MMPRTSCALACGSKASSGQNCRPAHLYGLNDLATAQRERRYSAARHRCGSSAQLARGSGGMADPTASRSAAPWWGRRVGDGGSHGAPGRRVARQGNRTIRRTPARWTRPPNRRPHQAPPDTVGAHSEVKRPRRAADMRLGRAGPRRLGAVIGQNEIAWQRILYLRAGHRAGDRVGDALHDLGNTSDLRYSSLWARLLSP